MLLRLRNQVTQKITFDVAVLTPESKAHDTPSQIAILDGRVIEVQGNPMPSGGFVMSFH